MQNHLYRYSTQLTIHRFLIERITLLNSMSHELTDKTAVTIDNHPKEDAPARKVSGAVGIWCLASYMNHNCIGNAHVAFIGDMIIVRAARPLPANTEITFPYVAVEKHYEERQARLEMSWQFNCSCGLCQAEAGENPEQVRLRNVLLGDISEALQNTRRSDVVNRSALDAVQDLLDAVRRTYQNPASVQPRISMSAPLLALAESYGLLGNSAKVVETCMSLFHAMGYVLEVDETRFAVAEWGAVTHEVLQAVCLMWDASHDVASRAFVNAVEEVLRVLYVVVIGEENSFEERIGGSVRR